MVASVHPEPSTERTAQNVDTDRIAKRAPSCPASLWSCHFGVWRHGRNDKQDPDQAS